jgi:predicted nucleotidyltransferase component of viral defense system
MPQEILSRKTKNNLATLKLANILSNFYLAGGTGLALKLRHRISLDLDFFTKEDIDTEILIQKIKNLGKFSVEKESESTLIGNFEGTRITFLKYDYPLLFPLKEFEGIKVADERDIGCMKISAISSRGTKKDFIDLYFLCQKIISLKELLKLFKKKYKSVDYNLMHILKSLVYFEDAEKDPLPKMILPISWEEVKKFFKAEIKKIK